VLVFTSKYDAHKGVVAYVRVVDGVLKREQLHLLATATSFTPTELGVFRPQMEVVSELGAGEVGYIATGLKDVTLVRVGDTITTSRDRDNIRQLPGYKEPQPIVYMDFYPVDGDDYVLLVATVYALDFWAFCTLKLCRSDWSASLIWI
jgi:GTP-binding protein LepA